MTESCAEMHLLIQADVDGELGPAEGARVANHLATCPHCPGTQARLLALSAQIRREVAYWPASGTLRNAVRRRIDAHTTEQSAEADPRAAYPSWRRVLSRRHVALAVPFGAGFALAAALVLAVMAPHGKDLTETLVAGHIRALQPGHLVDIVSTDQHSVKPWFDGRLDFAPPVKDLKADGFPLAGGRLDYIANRPVAALVYQRRQHLIDLFVWPESGGSLRAPAATERSGYNVLRWNGDGMVFCAVSDLGPRELAEFVRLWQGAEHAS